MINSTNELRAIQVAIQSIIKRLEQIEQENEGTIYVIEGGDEAEDGETEFEQQIRALKRLLDDGLLTPEEYEAKKKQVLGL